EACFGDDAYRAAGAAVVGPEEVLAADLVAAVRCPSPEQAGRIRSGASLVTLLGRNSGPAVEVLAQGQVTVLSLERVPRITRAQSMDVLSSQATVAGYQAVL
ncbi:MAG TPA: hypothetical protein PLL69_11185, partial [Gemmatimonadales bacterium]|nr:hypothetical protein [Gemmatimonadales bacterium]